MSDQDSEIFLINKSTLLSIADAIRVKTGKTGKLYPSEMDEEILSIEVGNNESHPPITINIQQSEHQTIYVYTNNSNIVQGQLSASTNQITIPNQILFYAQIQPEQGYTAGTLNQSSVIANWGDTVTFSATPATEIQYKTVTLQKIEEYPYDNSGSYYYAFPSIRVEPPSNMGQGSYYQTYYFSKTNDNVISVPENSKIYLYNGSDSYGYVSQSGRILAFNYPIANTYNNQYPEYASSINPLAPGYDENITVTEDITIICSMCTSVYLFATKGDLVVADKTSISTIANNCDLDDISTNGSITYINPMTTNLTSETVNYTFDTNNKFFQIITPPNTPFNYTVSIPSSYTSNDNIGSGIANAPTIITTSGCSTTRTIYYQNHVVHFYG